MNMVPRMSPLMAALLTVLLAGACKSTPQSQANQTPFQLEWHFASDKPKNDFVEMSDRDVNNPDKKIWVDPRPMLRLSDISNAARSTSGDDFLYLNVKIASRVGLQSDTGSNVKELLALLIKGKVVYVATLQSSLSRQMPVRIGAGGITEAEAEEILSAVRAAGGAK